MTSELGSDLGPEQVETVVIGAGQAGLATGYHLAHPGREFVILDGGRRVGDNWRCHGEPWTEGAAEAARLARVAGPS